MKGVKEGRGGGRKLRKKVLRNDHKNEAIVNQERNLIEKAISL